MQLFRVLNIIKSECEKIGLETNIAQSLAKAVVSKLPESMDVRSTDYLFGDTELM